MPCGLFLSLTVGLVRSAPGAVVRSTPATGCDVQGAMPTTWPALPVSLARGSCLPGRSLAWWRRRCSVGSTMTPWWKTSSGPPRPVRGLHCRSCLIEKSPWRSLMDFTTANIAAHSESRECLSIFCHNYGEVDTKRNMTRREMEIR